MKKGLTLTSILMLILGVATLAIGVMDMMVLSGGGDSTEVKALMGLAFILLVLGGLADVIGGLLGLRAVKHARKSTGAVLFGLLALAVGIASVAMEQSVQNICACVIPLVYFICAVSVKAGRA